MTGAPSIGLNAGAGARAVYDSGSGSSTLAFVYDVRRGDAAGALDYANGTALTLGAGGAIRDAAGNAADLALPAPGPSGSPVAARNIVINTAIVSVNGVTSRNADGVYGAGARVNITVSFSEPVRVAGGGEPYLLLDTGAPGRNATFVASFGTWDVWFAYTVQPGDNTDALDYANGTALVAGGATIKAVGRDESAHLELPAPGLPGSLSGSKKIALDTSAPKVARVSSPNADGAYGPGSAISVNVSFTEPVLVTGAPRIELETGDTDRSATYASGSGTDVLLFAYTVEAGDMSPGLNYTGASALSLGGGTIKDAAGNDANLALPAPSGGDSLGGTTALVVDTRPPAVEQVSSRNSTSTYYSDSVRYLQVDTRLCRAGLCNFAAGGAPAAQLPWQRRCAQALQARRRNARPLRPRRSLRARSPRRRRPARGGAYGWSAGGLDRSVAIMSHLNRVVLVNSEMALRRSSNEAWCSPTTTSLLRRFQHISTALRNGQPVGR